MFDPWESTLEAALAAESVGNRSPFRLFLVARGVSKARSSVENGDGLATMLCMAVCARHGLVAPGWLASAFCRRVEVVEFGKALSWDAPESFGPPYKKGTRAGSEFKRMGRVVQACLIADRIKSKDPTTPVDAGFFESIGKAMIPPIGKTEAEKAYYFGKRMLDKDDEFSIDDLFDTLIAPANFE